MLMKVINCERMKCKGTLIWPAFFLIPIIPTLLGAGNYLSNINILQSQWYSFWTQVSLFYSNFFFAPLIGVYCAFLWRFENFHSCRNTLLTQPLRFSTIYCSKYVMVCVITLLTQLWFTVLYLIAGKVVGLPGLPPIDILGWIFRGTIGGWVIATIQYLVASVISNFAIPVAVGLLGGTHGQHKSRNLLPLLFDGTGNELQQRRQHARRPAPYLFLIRSVLHSAVQPDRRPSVKKTLKHFKSLCTNG